MRLLSACSVGMYGLGLYYFRGPLWAVDALFAVGLILLMTWTPGAYPEVKGANEPSLRL
jgi:hypothetical protein